MELLEKALDISIFPLFIYLCVIGCVRLFGIVCSTQKREIPRWASVRQLKIHFGICLGVAMIMATMRQLFFLDHATQSLPSTILDICTPGILAIAMLRTFVFDELKSRGSTMAFDLEKDNEEGEDLPGDHNPARGNGSKSSKNEGEKQN